MMRVRLLNVGLRMIEQHEVMALLLEACPSFQGAWEEHVDEYGNDLLYVAAGTFAHHLLDKYRAQDFSSLSAAGVAIERLHIEGSSSVQVLATIGLLEGIQNVWSNNSINPDAFMPFLGKESRRRWDGLNKFWSGQASHVLADG